MDEHGIKDTGGRLADPPPNLFVVVLYYIPLLFAFTVFMLMTEFRFSELAVGAVAMFGTALSALGLIVGSVHLRTDFLKGFSCILSLVRWLPSCFSGSRRGSTSSATWKVPCEFWCCPRFQRCISRYATVKSNSIGMRLVRPMQRPFASWPSCSA